MFLQGRFLSNATALNALPTHLIYDFILFESDQMSENNLLMKVICRVDGIRLLTNRFGNPISLLSM